MVRCSVKIPDCLFQKVNSLVSDACENSGLAKFWHDYSSLVLSNGVSAQRTGHIAPVWGNGLFVHLYGSLNLEEQHAKELAANFGLLSTLMHDEIDVLLSKFIGEADHSDFYDYNDDPSDYDSFYSKAKFLKRPFDLCLEVFAGVSMPSLTSSFYLLVDEDSTYRSYSDYFDEFFRPKIADYCRELNLDEYKIWGEIVSNRDYWINWIEAVDYVFLDALKELEFKFVNFLETLFCGGE